VPFAQSVNPVTGPNGKAPAWSPTWPRLPPKPTMPPGVKALPARAVDHRAPAIAVTGLISAHATAQDLARLVREHWSIEAHHHVRDVTFSEDTATSRTGSGPANLATIRATIIAVIKDVGYLHVPEGRHDHTTPAETLRLHGLN
jgi:hypothetical protein